MNSERQLQIHNSILSEYAVLGFEYGYSLASPQDLVIWEAQFGDFANGAQIIFDQFIIPGEKKWGKFSGLTLLLPHGYDGMGPEHSNARINRIVSMVDDNYLTWKYDKEQRCGLSFRVNIHCMNITTPANLFHALRRQIKRSYRKPLFIFSPKKLLRHKLVRSRKEEFLDASRFIKVIDDAVENKRNVKRILVCSGQVYFDLL